MAVTTRGYSLLKCLCLVPILLASIAQVAFGQTSNFNEAVQSLTLAGPDGENMMTCSMPHPFTSDTHVEWFDNGRKIKVVFLPQNTARLYESVDELSDLLGDSPKTVQCVIQDDSIRWVPLISNVVTLASS